jgi:hypothetical protein
MLYYCCQANYGPPCIIKQLNVLWRYRAFLHFIILLFLKQTLYFHQLYLVRHRRIIFWKLQTGDNTVNQRHQSHRYVIWNLKATDEVVWIMALDSSLISICKYSNSFPRFHGPQCEQFWDPFGPLPWAVCWAVSCSVLHQRYKPSESCSLCGMASVMCWGYHKHL